VLPEDGFFAVMDGMGGGDAGEVASKLIRNMLAKSMKGTADESPGEGDVEGVEGPFDAGEEDGFVVVDVLVEGDDVAVVFGEEGGEVGDDSGVVGAGEEEDGGGLVGGSGHDGDPME
jgi:hypothetical protein